MNINEKRTSKLTCGCRKSEKNTVKEKQEGHQLTKGKTPNRVASCATQDFWKQKTKTLIITIGK